MRRTVWILTAALAAAAAVAAAGKIALFNGKDLSGWTYYLWDREAKKQDTKTPMSAVWSVQDGVLRCKGRPTGYICTEKAYENYRLTLEWRWPEGTERGNSGVLLHTTTPNALGQWPKSIEVQLAKDNAGDFWVIGTDLDVPNEETRKKGRRHLNLTDGSEKPVGQWNQMVIEARGDTLKVWVNGDLVNEATNLSQTKGTICLQSEGAEIHFRNIYLEPLD